MIHVSYRRMRSGKRRAAYTVQQPERMQHYATYEHTVERWHA